MRTSIKIGDKDVYFEADALTPIVFRDLNGSDLLKVMYTQRNTPNTEMYETSLMLAFTMAKQADPDLEFNTYTDWIKSFKDDFNVNEVIQATQEFYYKSLATESKSKKKFQGKQGGN